MQPPRTQAHILTKAAALVTPAVAEWRFVWGVIAFMLIVTTIPYIYAYATTPPDKQFMGIMLDMPDHMQYFSWMREFKTAHLSANKLTPEPNGAIFFNLLWWGMARLGQALGLGYDGMYQILRLVSGTLFLLLVYRICAWHFSDVLMRRTAFLIATFMSGLGWALVVVKYLWRLNDVPYPLDLYVAEGNTFLCLLGYPHFLGAALYMLVFDLALRGQKTQQLRYAIWAGLVALFFGWQHAYDLVLVYGILGVYMGVVWLRARRFPIFLVKSLFIIGIISWWPALYSVLLTSLDPLWKEVLKQFANADVYTPWPHHLLILLGPAFILALFTTLKKMWGGARIVLSEKSIDLRRVNDNDLFVWSWFWASFGLVYLPVDFQIHMLNGWQVPIAILATQGLFTGLVPWLSRMRPSMNPATLKQVLVVVMLVVIVPTNVYLWAWRFVELARHDYPYYLHRDEVAALRWLEANVKPDDVVLSSLTVGQYVPAYTGAYAFLAHWAQTLDFYGKTNRVNAFFNAATPDAQRRQTVQQFSVDYVIYGPAEKALGNFVPGELGWLKLVFETPQVKVFAVGP